MRNFSFILFISLLLISCTQNDKKQKESEQKAEIVEKQKDAEPTVINSDTIAAVDKVTALAISPLDIEGDMNQVTFSQQEKTLFYYNLKSKKGKIKLNGNEYILTKYAVNSTSGSYILTGDKVSIVAPNCKYAASEGGDCNYGKFAVVTITLGAGNLKLNKVDVQDCPDY